MVLHNGVVMLPYLACAAVLVDIMKDVGIPASGSAFVITIITIVSGVFMFFGGSVANALGYVKGYWCSIVLEIFGILITAMAPNFAVFMIGRILFACGYGLSTTINSALGGMWFKGAQYASFNTAKLIAASVGGALAYMIIGPLTGALGTWRRSYLVFMAVIIVFFIFCLLFIRYPEGVEEGLKKQKAAIKAGQIPKPQFPLARVRRRRNYILLAIASLFVMMSSSLFQTYLPTFLTAEKGLSTSAASNISGVSMFAGIAGSLICGILVAKTGRRKIYHLLGCILFTLAGLGAILFRGAGGILIMYALVNVAFYVRMPAMTQYYLEEIVPFDPSIVSPAVAVVNGLPMLLNVVGSFIASPMTANVGYGKTLLIFQLLCIISIICALFVTECGPRAKRSDTVQPKTA